MNKINFKEELEKLIEKFHTQKVESLKSLETFKQSLGNKFDIQIAKIYKKRNLKGEVNQNKEKLKKQKLGVWYKLKKAGFKKAFRFAVSAPFIYMMIIPSLIMHLCLEIYHQICFRLYGIPLVKPSNYFIFDRKSLPYLNWFERLNCFYCSYFNCLVAYLREIAGRTERFWCPIKHSKQLYGPHEQFVYFVDYSNGEALRENWEDLRKFSEYNSDGELCEDGVCFR